MQRYLLEGVPQLYHKSNDVAGIFEDVEDMLEHLVIVPRECEYGVVPGPAQAQDAMRVWSTYKPSMASHPAGRIACLKGWLPVSILVQDTHVRDHIASLVKQSGLWSKAQQLSRDVVANLQNKPLVVATFLTAAEVPLDGFRLLYFDPLNDGIRYDYVPRMARRR
jgi:hypothetical protein